MESPAQVHAATASVKSGALSPLRDPIFRTLWIAAVISYTGSWMQNIATGWLMTSLTSSPMLISLVQVALSLPVLLIALPAGAIADLVDRRKFLLITQTSMVGASMVLGILTITGTCTPTLLLIFTFLLGVGAVMNDPAWQALTPDLVPPAKLANAVALNSAGFNIARAVGPALGGLVIATAGSGAAFLLNAVSFFGVILFLYRWKPAPREPDKIKSTIPGAMSMGLRFARQDKRIRAVPGADPGILDFRQCILGFAAVDRQSLWRRRLRHHACLLRTGCIGRRGSINSGASPSLIRQHHYYRHIHICRCAMRAGSHRQSFYRFGLRRCRWAGVDQHSRHPQHGCSDRLSFLGARPRDLNVRSVPSGRYGSRQRSLG